VQIQDLDAPLARHFGLDKDAKGVVVADVMESGPAREAGLKTGDVVLRYDGKAVDAVRELQRLVAETAWAARWSSRSGATRRPRR